VRQVGQLPRRNSEILIGKMHKPAR